MNSASLITDAKQHLRLRYTVLILLMFLFRTAPAAELLTNAPPKWSRLAEVLRNWDGVEPEAIQRAAEAGDLTARHYLGYCYAEGYRFEQDTQVGVRWYLRAGEAGYLPSFSNLGVLYHKGTGVPQDFAKAFQYYSLAADGGLDQGQVNLGILYRDGLGVQRDFHAAMKWFRLAADQGHRTAMVELGRAYRFGRGVSRDLQAAERWFRKAAEGGDSLAGFNLGALYQEKGDLREAIRWFKEAAEAGSTDAMVSLYFVFRSNDEGQHNTAEALMWLTKGAEAGSPYAQCLLGEFYDKARWEGSGENRRLLAPNTTEAIKWFRRAAEQNWAGAQYHLGRYYVLGKGVEQDEEFGLELIRKAVDQGHVHAMSQLARLYARGIGQPRHDQERPVRLLTRITQVDDPGATANYYPVKEAYEDLVLRYEYGLGVHRDIYAAAESYCRAAMVPIHAFSIADKIEPGPEKSRPLARFAGEAERSLISIQSPVPEEVSKRLLTAISKYLQAADGQPAAAAAIAQHYIAGRDVPKDPIKAWMWLTHAMRFQAEDVREKLADIEARMEKKELEQAKEFLPAFTSHLDQLATFMRQSRMNESRVWTGFP